MSSSESDISWDLLRRIVRSWAGSSAELAEVKHMHGGSVSDTLGLTLKNGEQAVMKISPHRVDRAVAREAQQLAHLRMLGVPVPTVYQWRLANLDEPDSYLLMEWVEGVDLAHAKEVCSPGEFEGIQEELARVVLMMHGQIGPAYMRVGAGGPEDGESESWPAFFAGVYEPMWAELEKNPATTKACRKSFGRVREALFELLAHEDLPRLVHWDLWAGNIMVRKGPGGWHLAALLDPMCKYAHAEAELAYLEMFGTVTPTFLREYKARLRPGERYAAVRRHVYQLYFLLDHAAFFGGSYHEKFAAAAERVAALI